MASHALQTPRVERLVFWGVAALLLLQVGFWISVQFRESNRLLAARIAQMRAARAEAWQFDSMGLLRINLPRLPSEGPGVVVGLLPDTRSLEDRIRAIEARFPEVVVVKEPVDLDDPVLLADQTVFITLRRELLERMEDERIGALIRASLQALVLLAAVFLGLTYINRKLNTEMEVMLRQRNFLASVTHELKTPIASLRVWMETVFDRPLEADQRSRIRAFMDGDLQRLAELVGNLLEVARAEAGRLELSLEAVDLAPWLRRVCEAMDQRLGSGALGLRLDVAEGLRARIDPNYMGSVVENLLSNAFKYAPVPRETRVTLDADGEDIVLVVSDRGHGIASKDLPRIFQRFSRLGDEMTRSVPGTGLGLFLCREIVRAHGGEIRASSRGTGCGTTFTVRFGRVAR
ncbi:MAG: Alkaline phosphatase synthesis sensor protein PhoR [Acidobacteria bacterium ADurb.Bin340]|nr:MAG: Alkaline phosphatase synthesis sensor protein PhoR [Acidobacteria bacterium ADurb.Bin340]